MGKLSGEYEELLLSLIGLVAYNRTLILMLRRHLCSPAAVGTTVVAVLCS